MPYCLRMVRRLTPAILVVFVAACAGAAADGSGRRPACGPANAHTLAASRAARVYVAGSSVYGCAGPKRYLLGRATICNISARVDGVAVAGRIAAYGLEQCGVDTGRVQIELRNLSSGRALATQPAVTGAVGPESFESVGSIVVRADGSAAWIASARSIIHHNSLTEVHRLVHGGQSVLDSSAGIVASSLRLHGTRLTWRDGSKLRAAQLP